jgi:hypothetical protein
MENANQQQHNTGADRLAGLGGSADAMNLLRAATGGGLTTNPSPASIAEVLAILSRARGGERGGYAQDPHDPRDPRRDHY